MRITFANIIRQWYAHYENGDKSVSRAKRERRVRCVTREKVQKYISFIVANISAVLYGRAGDKAVSNKSGNVGLITHRSARDWQRVSAA